MHTRRTPAGLTGPILLAFLACLAAPDSIAAKDDAPVSFIFAFPEEQTITYDLGLSEETNWSGMSITTNQNYRIEATLREVNADGAFVIEIACPELKSYRMIDDDMQDWAPPLQLEGKSIIATVGADGELVDIKPGGNIPGMRSPGQLRPYARAVFVPLPAEPKTVGDSWEVVIRRDGNGDDVPADAEETPVYTGTSVYTFKKVQKKNGIDVAFIEIESTVAIDRETEQGRMTGENKGKTKVYLAIEGGWVVESKSESEFKGAMTGDDGAEHEIVLFTWTEMKLRK
ncbi:MAG: hypothetical protein JW876_00320 [Candidatus Krumholzibacteriota bacterium]|nr:hypothetical protein [Candidatus Krumholzibacteriota bacterium]